MSAQKLLLEHSIMEDIRTMDEAAMDKNEEISGEEELNLLFGVENENNSVSSNKKADDNANLKRKKPLPKEIKIISPIETFQSIVNNYDSFDFENVYSHCLSFMLRNIESCTIKAGETVELSTNYAFISKKRRSKIKSQLKNAQEEKFHNLSSSIQYHVYNNIFDECNFVFTQFKYGNASEILDKQFMVHVSNYSVQDFNLSAGVPLCKIYFYTYSSS